MRRGLLHFLVEIALAKKRFPFQLVEHLAPGGRIIIPVGQESGEQYLEQVDKAADGSIKRQKLMGVRYVPLTDKEKQCRKYL